MCYPLDVDLARDLHVERDRDLEVENRLALRAAAVSGRTARNRRR